MNEEKDKIDTILDIILISTYVLIALWFITLFIVFNVKFMGVPRAEIPDWAKWLIWRN